jgi:hypothetical protein
MKSKSPTNGAAIPHFPLVYEAQAEACQATQDAASRKNPTEQECDGVDACYFCAMGEAARAEAGGPV